MQEEDDLDETPPFQPLYNLLEKVREANLELETLEAPSEDQPRPARVKFKEEITEFEFWDSEDDWSGEGLLASTKEEDANVLISDDDDIELLPLEEEVRLGFPHGAEMQDNFEDDDEPARPRVGPSSVDEEVLEQDGSQSSTTCGAVRSISEELCLHLDLRDSSDDEQIDYGRQRRFEGRTRPWTAPSAGQNQKHRDACKGSRWTCAHLPHYNGLRSEYGLSKEQLEERKRLKRQIYEERREMAIKQQQELQERHEENERNFRAWMVRKQAEKFFYGGKRATLEEQRVQKVLAEARKQEAEESYKEWLRRKRQEKRTRIGRHKNRWTIHDFERMLGSVDDHTERTFRIYLGFSK
ncbi:coiled-coil domain-containing protein 181 [Neocloeon triangulifer]|uniref:coiled-coil domain-containing protein 181 n=1 Tax=Neocloeon triangulifer TaxID=2078957 RepID=UPI00286F564F|nr:coiled-coil domain-containing protein 181 [Neocloeon triangulifer]